MSTTTKSLDDQWHSLRSLLEKHSPADIATAIEKYGVYVYDRFNRVVTASDEIAGEYSQAIALNLVANWHAELNDPGPKYSWDHQRYELETHPTERFGWPDNKLPNFNVLTKSEKPKNSQVTKSTWTSSEWIQAAQTEAEKILIDERRKGVEPKQDALAKDVKDVLDSLGVKTARGPITWENIKRMALAGDWWRATRKRQVF
jgi:hypothetical protein